MTGVALAAAAGCVVVSGDVDLRATDDGWRGRSEWLVATADTCPFVDVTVTPGVTLDRRRVRLSLLTGNGRRPGADHWERLGAGPDGATIRLHLPEVRSGDRARLRVDWTAPVDAFAWAPGAAVDTLTVAGARTVDPTGATFDGGEWVAFARDGERGAVVHHPAGTGPAWPGPARVTSVADRVRIDVGGGDPQARLYPGGGSTVHTERTVTLEPADAPTSVTWELPPAAQVAVPEGWAWTRWGAGSVTVTAPAHAVEGRVTWSAPDAPSCGTRDGLPADHALVVEAIDGEVVWDDAIGWRLATVRGDPVTPARDDMVRALDRRFAARSLRMPAIPAAVAGPGWDRVEVLLTLLHDRASPARYPSWPDWPRPLVEARNSGAVTPIEGALVLAAMLDQVDMDGQWVLVRPAPLGDTVTSCPLAYPAALVAVTHEGALRFVDPGCRVCAPFELRPWLEDASALGAERTPPATPGRFDVERRADAVSWTLEGPPALLLRLALADLPRAARLEALAERIAGPGATLTAATGIADAGAPITLTARGAGGEDPLALDGSGWLSWIGERRLIRPADGAPDARAETPGAVWERTTRDGVTTEVLRVTRRRLDDGARRILTEARTRSAEPAAPEAVGPE